MSARSGWFTARSKSVESLAKLHHDVAALASTLAKWLAGTLN